MVEFLLFIIAIIVAIPVSIWQGYVFSIMWGWFVVPVFGAPPLTVAMAIGVALTASLLTSRYRKVDDDSVRQLFGSLMLGVMLPALVLGIGWVVTGFLP